MAYKTCIIGMGKMGRIRYNELQKHPAFEVVAISDVNETVASEFPHLKYTQDWKDILKEKYDVVFVCTYNNVIVEIVIKALESGAHVFSEKPPGRNVQEVLQMKEAFEKCDGQVLKFGFNHRFHNAILEAKAMIESGRYGDLIYARGNYGKAGGIEFKQNWRGNKELSGGGILLDQGIHMLDLMRFFLGEFVHVKSYIENLVWKDIDIEDNAFALMKTADNKVAMVHSSATQWKNMFNLELFCLNGYVKIEGLITGTRSYGEERVSFCKKPYIKEGKLIREMEETLLFDEDSSWELELADFYDCISGKSDDVTGNINDALRTMELICNIYEEGGAND